jgi:hypothetical protein
MNRFPLIFFLISIVIISGCSNPPPRESSELDDFALCLKESGFKMYGSFTCSVCKRQKALFGSSFELFGEIECHPRGENPQTELCLQKDIQKTPTWILEGAGDEVRLEGFQKLEKLAEVSGCTLPQDG